VCRDGLHWYMDILVHDSLVCVLVCVCVCVCGVCVDKRKQRVFVCSTHGIHVYMKACTYTGTRMQIYSALPLLFTPLSQK
jgi:hypothetical protein